MRRIQTQASMDSKPQRTKDYYAEQLEKAGWLASMDAEGQILLSKAFARAFNDNLGVLVTGRTGSGKTLAVETVFFSNEVTRIKMFRPDHVEFLEDLEWVKKFQKSEKRILVLDDVGAEHQVNDYGIRKETFADWLMIFYDNWKHSMPFERKQLIITTNLCGNEIEKRYGSRVISRLKEMTIPVVLKKDNRPTTTNF